MRDVLPLVFAHLRYPSAFLRCRCVCRLWRDAAYACDVQWAAVLRGIHSWGIMPKLKVTQPLYLQAFRFGAAKAKKKAVIEWTKSKQWEFYARKDLVRAEHFEQAWRHRAQQTEDELNQVDSMIKAHGRAKRYKHQF